jgi:hypothetical protein
MIVKRRGKEGIVKDEEKRREKRRKEKDCGGCE